jgi:hypothetical protein
MSISTASGNKDTRKFINRATDSVLTCYDNTDNMVVTDEVVEAASCAADAWGVLVVELKARRNAWRA